jgi:AMP nucleosidase
MKTRREIVENWLPRYTGVPLDGFGDYILLTNFQRYVKLFAQWHRVPVHGRDKPMPSATAGRITIVNFGMGSATAATVMDLLSAIDPKAVLFLGKCGGIKHRAEIGDLILPIAAIRGDGTSNDYFPPEVPALPAFALQKGDFDHDSRPRPRLLDRHGLHHQPARLGTRRQVQEVPAQDQGDGSGHGNGHYFHDGFL